MADDANQVAPIGYYCDHSDEPHDARTHHDWEWVEGEGLVFTHQPDTISAHIGLQRYLKPENQERRCPRAEPVYSASLFNLITADLGETREELKIAERRVEELADRLAKYEGHEPTVDEEMAYLNRCLNAVIDVCDKAESGANRWQNPLPVPEWVPTVRAAASGNVTDDEPAGVPW
ncbi:hypothetical protein [Streptomyces sp. NRRL F-2664]|uniref:hypothetical protein n=1 Tax=Streptomyces sp. NRRL F-2664 TaxID=1463842 RepID=UPI0004C4E10A|nr:hypothetical protein [Streptomyces sp. NRRL F-2664]